MDENDMLNFLPSTDVLLKLFTTTMFKGKLCLSKHNLMVMDSQQIKPDFYLLLQAIDSVKLINENSIEIKTKNFKIYNLIFDFNSSVEQLYSNLVRSIEEDKVDELFPFVYKPDFRIIENGWTAFLLKEEFTELLMSGKWCLTPNKVCSSYGKFVILPAGISESNIRSSSEIHLNNRYPVFAYYHRLSQSTLLRCSQYVNGMEKIGTVDPIILQLKFHYRLVDLRSKGPPLDGRILKYVNFGIDKIESLGSQLKKFVEVQQERHYPQPIQSNSLTATSSIDGYLSRVASSHWLDRVQSILLASKKLATYVISDSCNYVLIGDTGYDFELVVSSLVQIMLDPDARTIRGFEALIDREWIQAGHPFYDRCRSLYGSRSNILNMAPTSKEAPVFLLFLDSVWQMYQYNRLFFEFNEYFLQEIAEHTYFSKFGTFLGNSEEHRNFYNITEETTSLWSYMNQHDQMTKYMNPIYEPIKTQFSTDYSRIVCWPPIRPQDLKIWHSLYSGSEPLINSDRDQNLFKLEQETMENYRNQRNINIKLRKLYESIEKDLKKNIVASS